MKKVVKVILIVLIVFSISTYTSVKILLNNGAVLTNFEILSVTNKNTDYTVVFQDVKAANNYVIEIIEDEGRKVFSQSTKKNKNTLSLTNLEYNKLYSIMVYAYDEVGDVRPAIKPYKFRWGEPTFPKDAPLLLNDQDYELKIDGDLTRKDYKLRIESNGEEIENAYLKDNSYIISKDIYFGKEKELKVFIMNEDTVIDEINLFNKMNPVTDLNITTPQNMSIQSFNDVAFSYEGGDNASQYIVNLKTEEDKLVKSSTTTKKSVVFAKGLFALSKTYKLEVIAAYGDYKKSASVMITISDQEQLKPVYISNNWKYVKKGTKIELKSDNEDATIYYTLNGKNPESFGLKYESPIEITKNVTLKTVAVKEDKLNSIINTYDINVGVKKDLKVYLSPSNQYKNLGVLEVGYTNEMDEMNDLSDYIEERLKKAGVKVYRNNPSGNINLWLKDSNYAGVDLHIAVHSNASNLHDTYGIETWINSESSKTFSIANNIQNNLVSIYPYNKLNRANRGVRYANGALGEVNDLFLPFGILVEIAHHDYKNDAEWIMQNKQLIGYNIADSILEYYQIIG